MAGPRVAVVIPAFNEAQTIGLVVRGVLSVARVIVVDDGSSDQTVDLARAAGAIVVRHSENKGYDAALASGFAACAAMGSEFVVTMDADGQHASEAMPSFIRALDQGADVVVGVRERRQRWAETVFAAVTRIAWGVRDPLCGMKGYRTSVYQALGHFDSYASIGTELMLFAARRGMRIEQVAVPTQDRIGAPRFGRALSANWQILHALFRGLRRRNL
jgi:glycosyltransferase involved in cell wall biosynthesis